MIHFKLVTPEKILLEKELASLSCPTTMGQITILPNHAPLIATLVAGELVAKTGSEEFSVHVAGGFVEVHPGGNVSVLADAAEHDFEISEQRAEEAKKRAEEALKRQSQMSEEEYAKVAASLERSLARLKIVRRHRARASQNRFESN